MHCQCRFLKGILVSNFREAAAGQKHVVGIHHDLAKIFAELSQNLAGAPSNALLVGLLQQAAPRKMKTNVWARLRGQKEQLTIKVLRYLCIATLVNTPGMQISSDNSGWAYCGIDHHILYCEQRQVHDVCLE